MQSSEKAEVNVEFFMSVSLCMQVYGVLEVNLHSFLTMALVQGE
jgi:hypothetical protein